MARRSFGAKKKKEPAKVEWERLPLVDKLVQECIDEYEHDHLERAKIICLGKPRAGRAGKCGDVVKLKTPTKALIASIKHEGGTDVHYVIELGLDRWDRLDAAGRKRELDHALCHAGGLDEKGRWFKLPHDVEEFTAILKRHGLQDSPGMRGFVVHARQMKLSFKLAGADT
jgi:hypothetical protein